MGGGQHVGEGDLRGTNIIKYIHHRHGNSSTKNIGNNIVITSYGVTEGDDTCYGEL